MGYMSFASAAIYHPAAIEQAKKKARKRAERAQFINDCIARGASYPQATAAYAKHEQSAKNRSKAKYLKAKRLARQKRLAAKAKARQNQRHQGSDRNPDQGTSSQETKPTLK